MKTVKRVGVLAAVVALAFLSIRCERPPAPRPPAPPTSGPGGGVAVSPPAESPPSVPPEEAPPPLPAAVQDEAKRAHEQSAMLAVSDLKSLLASRDYDGAQRLAANASKDYADTLVAAEYAPLQKQAEEGAAAAARDRAQAAAAPEDVRTARHARFVQARDAGVAAMDKQDYALAVASFQTAVQEEDDPDVRDMLQQATTLTGKPRLAVAQFSVAGDVGIPDAGRTVPELMLGRFDPQRFQLVERAWLASTLAGQGLSLDQVVDNPKVLRVKRIWTVRYLVVGTVSRLATLAVSARMVDVVTGDVIQTAEVTAADAAGLQNSLGELAAILQMTNDEKAKYLAFRERQADAVIAEDPGVVIVDEAQRQADLEAERQRIAREEAEAFQRSQHERDALTALADVKAFIARADYTNAVRYARWAVARFGDTAAAPELADLKTLAETRYQEQLVLERNAAEWARAEAERAARHQRFRQARDQGLAALAANDLPAALAAFQNALNEEDDPDVRAFLDQVIRRMERPGIAVVDFEVRGDIGLPRREAGPSLAEFLLRRFAQDERRYRVIGRDEFAAILARAGLRMDDVARDPAQPRMRLLRGVVRYVVVGVASPGSIRISATLFDLEAGRPVQTADVAVDTLRALPRALADVAAILQMTDREKDEFLAQQAYADWLARGDAAAAAGRWDDALDAFRRAYRIRNTQDALDRMTDAARKVEDLKRVRRDYDAAMAAADAAVRDADWERALGAFRAALAVLDTPEARAGLENARRKLIETTRDRQRLYDRAMADAAGFARTGNWVRALEAYQQAFDLDPRDEAKDGVALAKRKIAEQEQARRRAYADALARAKAAIQAGNWQKALEAFTQALAVENTPEAANGVAAARRRLAELQANTRLYDAAMADAKAAAQAGDWQKALDAYTRAAAVFNTPDAQAGVALARKRLADIQQQDRKRLYDAAMADAAAHARAGQWQEALDAYRTAYNLDKTKEAVAGITTATKMLNDAAYNKRQYDQAMAAAKTAAQAGDWQKALNAYQQAAAIDATPDARAGVDLARRKLAETAAADKKREYARLMKEGDAAARAGEWQKALDAYTKAAAIDNTTEAQEDLAGAKKALADAAAAAAKRKDYTRLMTEADAAVKAGDWQKALGAFNKAAAIENTPEVRAGIANAQKKLADAAAGADKKKQYDKAMADGDAAAKAGQWQKALDAYEGAAKIDDTPEAKAGIANAKKKLADAASAADKKKQYDKAMADGDAAAKAGQWQKALDAYEGAAKIDNTPEAKAGIANAKKKLADAAAGADKKKQYDKAMADGDAAAKAGQWQKALDAYEDAAKIDNTPEAKAGISNAKKKLADAAAAAADKKKQYDKAMADGDAAAKAGQWQKALDAYEDAAKINDTPEAKAGIANSKKKLAEAASAADKRRQYDKAMADGDAAAKAGDWQKALGEYEDAAKINDTSESKAGIANAKKKLADAAAATDKRKQYDKAMADGDAAVKVGQWQKALDAYEDAAKIDDTPEAKAGIANAKKKLAEAASAADKKRQYDKAMADGDAAAKAGQWQKALDAYDDAAKINDTPEAKAGIANAKKKLADAAAAAADKKKQYDKAMADGDAAAKAGQWQKALDAYEDAAKIDDTPEAKAGIANAKKKLAEAASAADKKRQYDKAMADGDAAAKAGQWQKALDAYEDAAKIDDTPEAKAGIANAKKKLADAASAAADKKRQYDKAIADAEAAVKAGDWRKAFEAYQDAVQIDNTPEAKAGFASTKKKAHDKAVTDAKAAVAAKDWQKAFDAWQTALDADKTDDDAKTGLAQARDKLYDKALAEAKAAVTAADWQKALDAFTKAFDLKKTDEARAGIAQAKKKLGP